MAGCRKEKLLSLLIHSADPKVVITIFARGVCTSVRPHFSNFHKTKQISSENSDCYWRDYGFSRVDHWRLTTLFIWALYSWIPNLLHFLWLAAIFFSLSYSRMHHHWRRRRSRIGTRLICYKMGRLHTLADEIYLPNINKPKLQIVTWRRRMIPERAVITVYQRISDGLEKK